MSDADRWVDLGPLKLPRAEDVEVRPVHNGDGIVTAVTLVNGQTALQLQVFDIDAAYSWGYARAELHDQILQRGGTATELVGRNGHEIRARVPVTSPREDGEMTDVRFVGREGPGWLLRGVIRGSGAVSATADTWADEIFGSTVVEPATRVGPDCPYMELQWPPVDSA
ncbi:DUF3710 domain-containing protein [Streptomyces sp. A7024]|uniref:DUF3710 domain-containing protein n=1 Tax=Streptomyces coryli TaxID=1128680 RepID=A0A6G4U8M0_9ACTN|nr:DUF3710 domain-containing protein [Streptomyces coryli]NGN68579.1 DUF3710 domain-containing protein [Streptomyces coryli]